MPLDVVGNTGLIALALRYCAGKPVIKKPNRHPREKINAVGDAMSARRKWACRDRDVFHLRVLICHRGLRSLILLLIILLLAEAERVEHVAECTKRTKPGAQPGA